MAFKTVEEGEVSEDMTTGKREGKKVLSTRSSLSEKVKRWK